MGDVAGVIFDVDGCLVRGKKLLPGAAETIAELRRRGIRLAFCTNENNSTVGEVARKLQGLGVDAREQEVVSAALVAARVIKTHFPGKKVLAICGAGLRRCLEEEGVEPLPLEREAEAEVLVLGKDPEWNYAKLEAACRVVWRGASFVATNLDPRLPAENGFIPGTGAIIMSVIYATGKQPLVAAKPSRWAGEMCLAVLGTPGTGPLWWATSPSRISAWPGALASIACCC